jgi:hypothetical protein
MSLLLATATSRFFPWTPPWVAFAHNNTTGDGVNNHLWEFWSENGINWWLVSKVHSTSFRDPSLYVDPRGQSWIVATGGVTAAEFSVLTTRGWGWKFHAYVSTAGAGTVTATWAPQWFIDTDGSVHVLVSLQVSTRKMYELHPTNDSMTAWSTPVQVTGSGFATNSIDPNLTYWDGTYYLIYKDDGAGTLCLATSTSPFSGYTTTKTGNWAGWQSSPTKASIEGPQIVDIGTGWRIYFTHNSGYSGVNVYYSETTDRTMASGWSTTTALTDFSGYNHPLPIRRT